MMMSDRPIRIQRRRTKGWKLPPNTVCVTRPTMFGNHYRVGDTGTPDAATAVERYRKWLSNTHLMASIIRAEARKRLRGKNLACWCPLDQPCHADILLEIANA